MGKKKRIRSLIAIVLSISIILSSFVFSQGNEVKAAVRATTDQGTRDTDHQVTVEKTYLYSISTCDVDGNTLQDSEALSVTTLPAPVLKKGKTLFELVARVIDTMFNVGSTSYNITLTAALDKQMMQSPQIVKNDRWVNASRYEVLHYLDPSNYDVGLYKYQFLDLSVLAGISEEDMTKYLAGKGALAGKARIYLEAARKYHVNEVYLAAHSSLETGYGTSTLAKGVVVNGVKVYNMYGIGAHDSDPIRTGGRYAYKMRWTTPEKAILGGAKWISEQYINNTLYKQNTLYKMRWNPACPGDHMYATDVGWAIKQTSKIKMMYDNYQYTSLKFDLPSYK